MAEVAQFKQASINNYVRGGNMSEDVDTSIVCGDNNKDNIHKVDFDVHNLNSMSRSGDVSGGDDYDESANRYYGECNDTITTERY